MHETYMRYTTHVSGTHNLTCTYQIPLYFGRGTRILMQQKQKKTYHYSRFMPYNSAAQIGN